MPLRQPLRRTSSFAYPNRSRRGGSPGRRQRVPAGDDLCARVERLRGGACCRRRSAAGEIFDRILEVAVGQPVVQLAAMVVDLPQHCRAIRPVRPIDDDAPTLDVPAPGGYDALEHG